MEHETHNQTSNRVVPVDALRGYTMFLTVAGASLFAALDQLNSSLILDELIRQFAHPSWHGLTYFDLGFPIYLMLIGTSIVLSLTKQAQHGVRYRDIYKSVIRRAVVLFLLGIVYNGGFSEPWPDIRIAGVLQRLAVCYLVSVAIYLHMNTLGRCILLAVILLGYWALLALVPVPEYGAGNYSFDSNLVAYVDTILLPGRALFGVWDPEGILSTVPAIGTCICGILLGEWLQSSPMQSQRKAVTLLLVGVSLINAGLLWGEWLPINKPMWTSSYVVVTAGWCLVHLFVFFQISDVWQKEKWLRPLNLVGRSAIAVYVGRELIDVESISRRFVGGSIGVAFGSAEQLVVVVTSILLVWFVLAWLNRNNVDIKV